jgi:hypothetical protein
MSLNRSQISPRAANQVISNQCDSNQLRVPKYQLITDLLITDYFRGKLEDDFKI